MYLTEAEFETLATLPAKTLEKARLLSPLGDMTLAIDEFGGHLAGLFLAEIDLGVAGSMPESLPVEVAAEVTNDERFTGGALANITADDLRHLLVAHQIQ